jgi:hypothetical protein
MKLEFYCVVTERDSNFRFCAPGERLIEPEGPLIHEQYPAKSGSLEQARERAAALNGRYGWAKVGKVVVDFSAPENQP